MDKIKIFIDWEFLGKKDAAVEKINPLLYPIIAKMDPKDPNFTSRFDYYEYTSDMEAADFIMLPYYLNLYEKRNLLLFLDSKFAFADGKIKTLIWIDGDHELDWWPESAIIFHKGHINRSDSRQWVDLPEIPDLTKEWPIVYHEKSIKPKVAFTGQASTKKHFLWLLRNWNWKRKYSAATTLWIPPSEPHIKLRKTALDILEKDSRINADFIRRERYLGSNRAVEMERQEYLENLNNNPYSLCVRGGGNFSFRFFESLCLGGIPILIDTDVLLPFQDQIDWDKHILRVKWTELKSLPERLIEFHNALSEEKFIQLQKENRAIWLKYFSLPGYFEQLHHLLKDV